MTPIYLFGVRLPSFAAEFCPGLFSTRMVELLLPMPDRVPVHCRRGWAVRPLRAFLFFNFWREIGEQDGMKLKWCSDLLGAAVITGRFAALQPFN